MTDGIIRDTKLTHNCMFSRCKNNATYVFYSYEELDVYLCDKHTIRNIKEQTGYVIRSLR